MARRTRHAIGGKTPANNLPLGASAAVRPGGSPGLEAASGKTLAIRKGRSPGEAVSKGASLAVRRARGGPLGYLGVGDPAGLERLKLSRQRNEELGVPHYAKGGHAHKMAQKGLHSLYKVLHKHFAGDSEPEIQKKSGGNLWIQNAINPKNKGALHSALHVPKGQKIPVAKLHKAEHSKSPTLRKRAQLAETLRKFRHKPQGR